MNFTTLTLVLLVILSIIVMVSFLVGVGFFIFTPCERLSFSDKKEKSKILKFLKLR
jgi:hypothetical protein